MSQLSQTRILIVDDEPDMVQLIALMLEKNNVSVLTAFNGAEAIEKALHENPDIIITDLMMPQVDGFSVMQEVFAKNPHIPVIVTTAHGSTKAAIQALRLGAFDFLIKPLKPANVRQAVSKASRQQFNQKLDLWQRQITNAISVSRDLTQIARELLTLTATALGAEHGLIWWPDGSLPAIALTPADAALESLFVRWAKSAGLTTPSPEKSIGKILQAGELEPEDFFPASLIAIPLTAHKLTHCVLFLSHNQPDYFDHHDLSFLETLTPFAALAIDNARIYTYLKKSNQRLQTLQNINALTYNAKLPQHRILRLAVEGIRQNLNYSGVMVCLPDRDTNSLTIQAAAGHLDKFLRRKGDTPTHRIAFSLDETENPFVSAFNTHTAQDTPVNVWVEALEQAGAADMAQTLATQNISRCRATPLWQSDEVIGVLVTGHPRQGLSPEERATLSTLANQIALIITNAALYQAEQQGRREMAALYQAGLVITSTLSHTEVLKAISQQILDLTKVEGCIIGRWDAAKNLEVIELFLQKTPVGWLEKAPPGTSYSLKHRPLVKAALEQQHLKIIHRDDPDIPPPEQIWMAQNGAKMRLIIPLTIRSESIGVVELLTTQSGQKFTNKIIRITQGLAAQAAIALENARLHESEIKRMEEEMELARRIQISLLPHDPPKIPGLSIAARSVSARLVGGDFYRYLSLPKGQFGIAIGDVSGKGVPSALFMAVAITAIDAQIRQFSSPGDMLSQLNHDLHPRMRSSRMNTGLLVAAFDLKEKKLQVANAGMISPLLKQQETFQWVDSYGLPIGAIARTTYYNTTVILNPNTTIILASDGMIEAMSKSEQMFGFPRFQQSIRNIPPHASSQQILERIWQDVSSFIQDAEPHDDMTLMVVQTGA